jgi:hypothetical protein
MASRGVGNALDERSVGTTTGAGVEAGGATPQADFFGTAEVLVPFVVAPFVFVPLAVGPFVFVPFVVAPFVFVDSIFGFESARAI